MTGADLKAWRHRNRYRQVDLQRELQLGSRATISSWETSDDNLPRTLYLALTALERMPELRNVDGYEKSYR
ncbi:MAG: hypothetical protein GYB53_16505 [Rhodobacteraceae bacterium]|nr:hypothetical protein [Paracoccaceae bacterium]MBR9823127.1 hypothetical protein [Paracoccaceae bacterium]